MKKRPLDKLNHLEANALNLCIALLSSVCIHRKDPHALNYLFKAIEETVPQLIRKVRRSRKRDAERAKEIRKMDLLWPKF